MTDTPASPSHPPRRLIVCVDDFGDRPSISEAVLALADQQAITATSAMVLAPGWASMAPALKALRHPIDVGLHLDWTSEHAQQAGHGLPLGRAMVHSALRRWSRAAVQSVVERQLDLFEQQWGAAPDHVDGHQHVQQFPVIRQALMDALVRRYPVGQRPYLRLSRLRPGSAPWLKAQIVNQWGASALHTLARSHQWPIAAALTGMYGFDGDANAYRQHLNHWLHRAHDGDLLMCHPAVLAEDGDVIGPARLHEYQVLSHPDFPSLLRHHGITLVRGRALPPLAP